MNSGRLQRIALGLTLGVIGVCPGLVSQAMAQEVRPAWYNCLTLEVPTPEKEVWCDRLQTVQNATFIVPTSQEDCPDFIAITLDDGRYQRDDDQFIVELVSEQNWIDFGDINQDGKADAAVIFGVALDPEGRSVTTYLTTVLDVDGAAQSLTPVKLGERILLNGPIRIEPGQIVVPFLTATEAFDRIFILNGTSLRSEHQTSIHF